MTKLTRLQRLALLAANVVFVFAFGTNIARAEPVRLAPAELFSGYTGEATAEAARLPLPRPPAIEVAVLPNLRPISITGVWTTMANLSQQVRAGVVLAGNAPPRRLADSTAASFDWITALIALALTALLLLTIRHITRLVGISGIVGTTLLSMDRNGLSAPARRSRRHSARRDQTAHPD